MSKKSNGFATKKDVQEIVTDAAEAILGGVQEMFDEQDKKNEKKFATKEDLKRFATKEDLKREAGFLKDDIRGLKADLSDTPSRRQFEELKSEVQSFSTAS